MFRLRLTTRGALRRAGYFRFLAVALALAAMSAPLPGAGREARPLIFVSIPPQKQFVERVAGDAVQVRPLVPPGQSMEIFEPLPKQLARLGEARAFMAIGAPYEKRLIEKLQRTFPQLLIVNTREGVALRPLELGDTPARGHEPSAGEPDPHVWLDPQLVKAQAGNISRALSLILPDRAASFENNLKSFRAELDALDASLGETLSPLRGRTIFVQHACLGYFAAAYGLRQRAIEIGGKEPGPKQLATLIEQARAEGAKVIFVQPQFSPRTAQTLAREIGGAVVPLDDLAENYMDNMGRVAETLKIQLAKPRT